ncbi:uncharacterized protein LOC143770025 isoform X2 [Ranitomeya variabilis]|uniref:uncharacterized protein LOC143770025 isoform X2 n=1 Tax=Ranitomeya variabilis TaxID=490064 RepID=UPI0040567F80
MADQNKVGVIHKCYLCDAQFTNNNDKDTHYNGQFHKFMMGVRRNQLSYMGQSKTLNDQITETGKKESLIGLEYIYEYAEDSQGVRMYECKLCSSAFRVASIFFHIVGIRHRVLYLAKHHPIMGIEDDFDVQQQVHYRKLTNHALAIEQTHGRKKINVVEEVYVSKPNVSEVSDTEIYLVDNIPSNKKTEKKKEVRKDSNKLRRGRERAEKYRELLKSRARDDDRDDRSRRRERDSSSRRDLTKSLIHDEDFDARNISSASRLSLLKDSSAADSRSDRRKRSRSRSPDRRRKTHSSHRSKFLESSGDIDVRSVLPAGGISFRELKTANIGHLQGGISTLHVPMPKKKKTTTDKDSDSDMDVCSMDFSECEPDDFWCNEELFDYLKCYYIGDEEDVQFILEAIKTLSHALVRHKTRMEDLKNWIAQEKKKLEEEKKKFQEMKKRKEDKITSTKICEPEMLKLFNEVTGSHKKNSSDTGKDAQAAAQNTSAEKVTQQLPVPAQRPPDKVNQPLLLTNFLKTVVAGIPPMMLPATQRFPAVAAPQLVPGSQNPLVAGTAPVQQAAQKPPALNLTLAQQALISQKALMAGMGQILQQLFLRPQAAANPLLPTPSPQFNIRGPLGGTRPALGAASTTPSQNLQIPGPKLDNPNTSKEQWPFQGQGAGRYPAGNVVPSNPVTGYQQLPGSSTAPVQQAGPRAPVSTITASTTPSQNLQIPGPKLDNPNPSKEQWPFPGQGAGRYPENVVPSNPVTGYQQLPGSSTAPVQQAGPRAPGPETRYAQNPEIPGSRFNNRDPSKEQRPPLLGQGPGGYPAPMNPSQPQQQAAPNPQDANRFNQNPRPGIDIRGPVDGAGPGSETRFSQNQGPPVSRFDNTNPPKDQKSQMGQAVSRYPESDGRYNQNEAFPGPRTDSAGAPNKSGPPLGADAANRFNQNPPSRFDTRGPVDGAGAGQGPRTHFSQTPQVPVSRFDNPNVSKDSRSNVGQTAGRYLGTDGRYSQNEPYPGARTDNNGSFDKTRPPSGAGSEMRFSQNLQNPGPRFDNSNPGNQPKSLVGQAANRYQEPDTFYSQDDTYPGAWTKNNGSHDKTRPPVGADQQGNYKQAAWNSGPTSGKQGFYNEAQPASGMGTGRYDDQYTQNQWQSQYSSKEQYGAGIDNKPPAPQGLQPQPAASTGYSSEGRPDTWPSAAPAKRGVYPAGILKNKTVNPPS